MSLQVNFITTQSLPDCSGGWSGLSRNLYQALARTPDLDLHYVGPVRPPISRVAKGVSKVRRLAGARGRFYAFSEARLNRVRQVVHALSPQADYDLFLGATPWIHCRPERPYGVYLDACFRTYFDHNLKVGEFSPGDIRRIEMAEKEWLERANHVFWASAWSRDEAIRHYGLTSHNHHVVGIGGNLDVPEADTWVGGHTFLFIAGNFALKGGPVACAAFKSVRQRHPDSRLVILGQEPPGEFLTQPGVEYAGYLRKSQPEELVRFKAIIASAFCLVHPTTSDIVPQVIVECGCFGCPVIGPRRFAIPEIVKHQKTGLLLAPASCVEDFEKAMVWMIEDATAYKQMRRVVRQFCLANFTFETAASRMVESIRAS